ncbi:hypothetical protein [Bradyrhizobium sp. RT3a]|uniref:hypothetical protein n=1 Tax=Bradyrhizobium sp. RT3a TaxID=3156333 RepID=UPI0033968BC5
MPTRKQMKKLAKSMGHEARKGSALGPQDEMPDEYWRSVLNDVPADAKPVGLSAALRLYELPQQVLRVSCRRCERIIEIQKADAVRLYGQHAIWKEVGQRLLNNTCQSRTGRYEEDGCWPAFEPV